MDKQTIAEKFEKSILNKVHNLLVLLPDSITHENEGMFITVCEKISGIANNAFIEAEQLGCRDFFSGWRRLLCPFWTLGDKLEYAYGEGFTWKDFIDLILKEECNEVDIKSNIDQPKILFRDKNHTAKFCIELCKED